MLSFQERRETYDLEDEEIVSFLVDKAKEMGDTFQQFRVEIEEVPPYYPIGKNVEDGYYLLRAEAMAKPGTTGSHDAFIRVVRTADNTPVMAERISLAYQAEALQEKLSETGYGEVELVIASGFLSEKADVPAIHEKAHSAYDLRHVKAIRDIEIAYGATVLPPRILLFNENHISEAEAMRVLKSEEYNKDVLVIPQEQFDSLFLNK